MDTHAQAQPRSRKRARPRASEPANTPIPAPVTPSWSQVPVAAHAQAVRGHPDTVHPPPNGFPSQQLDRSHQVAETEGLMNGYSAPQHTQYPNPSPSLAPAPQTDPNGLSNLGTLAGDAGAANNHHQHHSHAHAHQQHHLQQQAQQQAQAQQQQQQQQQHTQHPQQQAQRPSAASTSNTDRVLFQQQYGNSQAANEPSSATVANPAPGQPYNLQVWPQAAGAATPSMAPQSPATRLLAPPPEGIYRSFEDLLASVQKVAKDQGYGVVKLRASNYRDGKPTRYDLVCDRGGVKYSSTAKKRNPSTRKVDCPWRAKAVCEVNLGNQWRFAVQESRHNHEARVPAAVPGQENTPLAQSIRSIGNKIDRMAHDMTQNFNNLEAAVSTRLENIEKRLDSLENGRPTMLAGNGVPQMGGSSMPTANMGGGNLGGVSLSNGTMEMARLNGIEARVNAMEQQRTMDGIAMIDDDPSSRLAMMVNS